MCCKSIILWGPVSMSKGVIYMKKYCPFESVKVVHEPENQRFLFVSVWRTEPQVFLAVCEVIVLYDKAILTMK